MKTNTAINVKIPQGSEVILREEKSVNYNGDFASSKTSSVMKQGATGMISALVLALSIGALQIGMVVLPITMIVASGLLTFGSIIGFGLENEAFAKTRKQFKSINRPISMNENHILEHQGFSDRRWRTQQDWKKGYCVSQKVRGPKFIFIFNPVRMFKPVLLNETVWYNPDSDIHTIEKTYARMGSILLTTEKRGGPRYSFRRALNSL